MSLGSDRFAVHLHDGLAVLSATGDIDVAAAGAFRLAINELVVQGHVHLVLDLTGVTFMDSSGLGVLVAAQRKIRAFRGSLTLAGRGESLLTLLRITGLSRVFVCHPTLEEACAHAAEQIAETTAAP